MILAGSKSLLLRYQDNLHPLAVRIFLRIPKFLGSLQTYYRGVSRTSVTPTTMSSAFTPENSASQGAAAHQGNWPPSGRNLPLCAWVQTAATRVWYLIPAWRWLQPSEVLCEHRASAGFPDVDDCCFQVLFQCLSVENLVFVICSILLAAHSATLEDLDVLHKCSEALIALCSRCAGSMSMCLFFRWCWECLSGPVPFIMGVHTSALASQEGIESLPSSVVVHLDYNK